MSELSPQALAWVRSQVALTQDFIYLNSGFTGPSPRSVASAARAWSRNWYAKGLTSPEGVAEQRRASEEARQKVASLLACQPEEVALTDNTSQGIALVAAGLDWREGDEVVTNDLEHPAGLVPWFVLRERWRVGVKVASFSPGADPLEILAQAITPRTRLVCISHVMYSTGLLIPVDEVARLAHQVGAFCLVDGAQAAGNMPLDMGALGCDFYSLPGQKWLLGPPGTGALYVRQDLQDRLRPSLVGWSSVASFDLEGRFSLKPSARRYEVGTQAYSLLAGLGASLNFTETLGREAVYGRIAGLAAYVRAHLQEVPSLRLTDSGPWGPSALVCFNLEGWEPREVVTRLREGWRIICRSIAHPSSVRVCPHFFNTEEEMDTLVEALGVLATEAH